MFLPRGFVELDNDMRRHLKIAAIIVAITTAFFAGYMANRAPRAIAEASTGKTVLYYACPMHPSYRADHAGTAPCCGMRLEPVYADSILNAEALKSYGPGSVEIGAVQQQLIGIRT